MKHSEEKIWKEKGGEDKTWTEMRTADNISNKIIIYLCEAWCSPLPAACSSWESPKLSLHHRFEPPWTVGFPTAALSLGWVWVAWVGARLWSPSWMATGRCGSCQTCGGSGRQNRECWVDHSCQEPVAHWRVGRRECYWGFYRYRRLRIRAPIVLQSRNLWVGHSRHPVCPFARRAADVCQVWVDCRNREAVRPCRSNSERSHEWVSEPQNRCPLTGYCGTLGRNWHSYGKKMYMLVYIIIYTIYICKIKHYGTKHTNL